MADPPRGGAPPAKAPSSSRSLPLLDGVDPSAGEPANEGLVCVECGAGIPYVYKEYSRGNIRLHRCVSAALGEGETSVHAGPWRCAAGVGPR